MTPLPPANIYGIICLVLFTFGVVFLREPSPGLRAQVIYSDKVAHEAARRAVEIEGRGINVSGLWQFVFSSWEVWSISIAWGLELVVYVSFLTFSTLYLVQGLEKTAAFAALLSSGFFWGRIASIPTAGVLSDFFRNKKLPCVLGTTIQGVLLCFAVTFTKDTPDGLIFAIFVLAGIIGGMVVGPTNALFAEASERISPTRMATAFSVYIIIYSLITQTWTFVAPSLIGGIGWNYTWVVVGVCSILAAVFYLQAKGALFGRERVIESYSDVEVAPLINGNAAVPLGLVLEAESASHEVGTA